MLASLNPRDGMLDIRVLCGLWGIGCAQWSDKALKCPEEPGSPAKCLV